MGISINHHQYHHPQQQLPFTQYLLHAKRYTKYFIYIYYTPVTTLTLFHYRGHKLYEDHGTSKWQSMRSENTIPSISSTTSTAIAMQISL